MDFYRIRWQYEPKTFPIEWDANHNGVKAFTPDFYLPDPDLFIEFTTMKQSLVTKKNRKVRADKRFKGRLPVYRPPLLSQWGSYVNLRVATGRARDGFKARFRAGEGFKANFRVGGDTPIPLRC